MEALPDIQFLSYDFEKSILQLQLKQNLKIYDKSTYKTP